MSKLSFLFPVEGIRQTIRRFPLSSACSVVVFTLMILSIHDVINDDEFFGRFSVFCVCGYFWFGVTRLIAESRDLSNEKEMLIALPVFAGIGAIVLFSEQWGLHLIFMIPALLLMIMVAPYTKDNDDLSFWFFNRMTWFGVAVAMLAGIIWGGGLSAALASIDYLFDVDVDEEIYGDIWAFSCALFGPLYALSWVPEKFSFTKEDCNDPPGLQFLLNWVLAPLIAIYFLILYAYFTKIALAWELPKGQLSYMITGFGGVGVATYLLGWPLREEGGPLLRLVYKVFFPAMLLPVVMQFVAIGERIGQYGITEQRYLIAMTALWFAAIAVGFSLKKLPLKFIPASLALLFAIGSFGPWGGVGVSGASQFSRLEALLSQHNLLVDGQIEKTEEEIPFEDRQSISSILSYLESTDREEWLRPWVPREGEQWHFPGAHKVTEMMGFQYVSHYQIPQKDNQFYFRQPNSYNYNEPLDVRGYDYLMQSNYVHFNSKKPWSKTWEANADAGRPKIEILHDGDDLVVKVDGKGEGRIDLYGYVVGELGRDPKTQEREMVLETKNDALRFRFVFNNISGEIKEDGPAINNANFRLMIGAR